jgi:dsRNA-specific ribonuclease
MNGLAASPRKKLSITPWVKFPPESASACVTCECESHNDEVESLDGIDTWKTANDECVGHLSSSVEDGSNGNNGRANATEKHRDVLSFFRLFLSSSSASPLQPIAVLQSRYDAIQHQQNKQAHSKSIKSWFRCQRSGALHDLWWTSDIVVPGDVAAIWNVNPVHGSGKFPLTTYQTELLSKETDGGNSPLAFEACLVPLGHLLLDLCGEWRQYSNTVQFKSKKAAQKSAALNLLIAVDLGEQPDYDCDSSDWHTNETRNVVKEDGMDSNGSTPNERFQLQSIRYYGAVQNPHGEFVSNCNPCAIQCIVSVKDVNCNDPNKSLLEVSSDFHQSTDDSFNDAFDKLNRRIKAHGATDDDSDSIMSAMKVSKPNIAYEVTLPKWATAKFESKFFLLELDFLVMKEGNEIPLSEAIGLDADVATRMGIVCGCGVYDDGYNERDKLSADFTLSSPLCSVVSGENVRVMMTNQTEVTVSEMTQQIEEQASPVINLREWGCPITLTKCFNKILFDHGKTYGMGPPVFGDFLTRISEDDLVPGGRRTYMFVPLCPRSTSNHKNATKIVIDWKVVSDVVRHKPLATAEGIPLSELRNRFLIQPTGFGGRVFITKNEVKSAMNGGAGVNNAGEPPFKIRDFSFGNLIIAVGLLVTALSFAEYLGTSGENDGPSLSRLGLVYGIPIFLAGAALKYAEFIAENVDDSSETSSSPLFPGNMISLLSDHFKEKTLSSFDGLQFSEITHVRYYEQFWKYSIRSASAPLIAALPLAGLSYEQHESTIFHQIYGEAILTSTFDLSSQRSISNLLASRGLLIPELTLVLPMPRDFLYLCQRMSNYVGKLERNYLLRLFAMRFCDLQRNNVRLLVSVPVSTTDIMPLIDKATRGDVQEADSTTTYVRGHERLETLGDSVLLHFIVLNLFVKMHSSTTEFVLDIFEQAITNQGKNMVLYKAALQIGLHRLINAGNSSSTKSWRAFYQACNERPTIEVARKQLSDTLESLIGATFLLDKSGCMTVGLLNEIGPCFPDDFAPGVNDNHSGIWYSGKGTCLTAGYPFHECPGTAELEQINGILQRNPHVHLILQRKSAAFCRLLGERITCIDRLQFLQSDPISSLLLHSALFDDSLDDDENNPDCIGLESLAKLRDKIFNVGNAALQLGIVSEIYHLYPASTSGDIHLMKTVLMSHDSLAYILLKNRFHECMFDENADATITMKKYMNEADLLGSKEWAKNGGWFIHGGSEEFHMRIQRHGFNSCPNPQYMGLAAGRLMGHMKKLPKNASEDLQFSMKSIVGAVALSFGVKDAWEMIRPYFLELMMLSPDELRISFDGISDLVSLYQKGRR